MNQLGIAFALRLAGREARNGLRRIGLYMFSIAIGVGALVSIQSFREEVTDSIFRHSREMVGADVRLNTANGPFGPGVNAVLDSLRAGGVDVARVSMATGMLSGADADLARLGQVVSIDGGYPYYGEVTSDPEGAWTGEIEPGEVFVSTEVAAEIGVRRGSTLQVGPLSLEVAGVVSGIPGPTPGSLFIEAFFGPEVYVAPETLSGSGLLREGTLATHEAFIRLPDPADRREFRESREELWDSEVVFVAFADEEADDLAEAASVATRFFGIIGVAALLLGGIGVASAIHIYILEKRTSVAVLRCLGAGRWTSFLAYLAQAAGLGLGGALLGGVVGTAMQVIFPLVISGLLPVEVGVRLSPAAWLAGMGVGVWVALVFALIPLLKVRRIPPLAALRSDFGSERPRSDPATIAAYLAVAASALILCILEAPHWRVGLAFAAALAVAVGALSLTAWAVTAITRRYFPKRMPYPVRQGVSNLFRPRNQTLALTIALGSGAFVIGLVVVMGGSLNRAISSLAAQSGQSPTVVFYNVDGEDRDGVVAVVEREMAGVERDEADADAGGRGAAADEAASQGGPGEASRAEILSAVGADRAGQLVASWSVTSMSIVEINWVLYEDLLADSASEERRPTEASYGTTVRAALQEWEEVVEGEWWSDASARPPGLGTDDAPLLASLALSSARRAGVELGDTVVWETGGVFVTTVISSLRETEGMPMTLEDIFGVNASVVLEPAAASVVPIRHIVTAVFDDPAKNARAQRAVRAAFPEVSVFDLYRVVRLTITVLERVQQGISILALFSILVGLVVMVGVLATSRAQRFREGALLRTLGASRRQVLTVLLTEFMTIGTLATFSGLALGAVIAIPLLMVGTDVAHTPQILELLGLWLGLMAATAAVGLLSSRGLLSRPPLVTLRSE